MATRSELVGEGHALSPLPVGDPSGTLELIDALHVCGPLVCGTAPHLSLGAVSG
ncbi:MAG: hypothetical protein JRG80_07110 [Deltaproteobacteria bacterium]|nr:hypothetical protein [Deltaproteobacteria bacterium]MBW2399028.1 hypothetical protein [Deltaproteobacteria bacterium]MBW2666196.1 hypothetical protein [Deltaproteobacteria bacterium]